MGSRVAAAGPAVFAAVVAVTRFSVAILNSAHSTAVLITGAITAAAGTAVLATAATVPVALAGVGLAAAGTAVLYPTLLSLVTAQVAETARGAAPSVVATFAYLGFLAGPVYVGRWSAAVGLPGAMLAVAALAAGLALLAWPVRGTTTTPRARPGDNNSRPPEATRVVARSRPPTNSPIACSPATSSTMRTPA